MAIYKFNPASPRVTFALPSDRKRGARPGDDIECSEEFAASINALYPGIDGAPALVLLDPPKPARKRKPRKPKAEG